MWFLWGLTREKFLIAVFSSELEKCVPPPAFTREVDVCGTQ